jgi:hypothetical protein
MLFSELSAWHLYNNSAVENLLFRSVFSGSRFFLLPDYGYIREFYPEKLDKRAFKCYIKLFDDIIIGILIRRVWRISVEEFFSAPPNREYSGQVFF